MSPVRLAKATQYIRHSHFNIVDINAVGSHAYAINCDFSREKIVCFFIFLFFLNNYMKHRSRVHV